MSTRFGLPDQRRIRRLADALLPGSQSMPSAAEIDLVGRYLDQIINLRADLNDDFLRWVRLVPDGAVDLPVPPAPDAEAKQATRLLLYSAYFYAPPVRDILDYHGQRAIEPEAEPDGALVADMLANVRARGAIWRHAP